MANVIKLKRGSGSDPTANDLVVGEVAVRTDTGKLFTKKDNGTIAEISGAGGSDIFINTLSASSGSGGGSATFNGTATRFTLSNPPDVSAQQLLVSVNGVVQKPNAGTSPSTGFAVDGNDIIFASAPETGASFFIVTYGTIGLGIPADGSVTTGKIADGAIVNADVNASAAIAGSKINPNFGSQDISTTGNLTLFGTNPTISFTDSNEDSDFRLFINAGKFKIQDASNSNADRFTVFTDGHIDIPGNLNCADGLDVTGNANVSADLDVDGIISAPNIDINGGANSLMTLKFQNNLTGSGNNDGAAINYSTNSHGLFFSAYESQGSMIFQTAGNNLNNRTLLISNTGVVTLQRNQESMLVATPNSDVKLYFDGNEKIKTTSSGIDVTGDLNLSGSGNTALTINTGNNSGDNSSIFFADSADADVGYINYDHGTNKLQIAVGASLAATIDSSGRVGIGTTSPTQTLDVTGSNGVGIAEFTNTATSFSNNCYTLKIDSSAHISNMSAAGAFAVDVNGGRAMTINGLGRVGIGITNPSTTLHLDASGGAVLRMQRIATNATNKLEFSHDGTDGTIDSTNDLIFRTGGGIKATLTDTGNLGIGTTSPDGKLHVTNGSAGSVTANSDANLLVLESNESNGMSFLNPSDERGVIRFGTTGTSGQNEANISYAHEAVSQTADRRRMFFKTGGNGLRMSIGNSGSHASIFMNCNESFSNAMLSLQTNGSSCIGLKATATNQQFMINFRTPNGEVGTITTSGSSTSYNTSSDYRLKENAVAISDGITRLKTLKPYRFNFKTDSSTTVDGFFAHEVTAVPEAITGTKDEVDSDNNPIYQGIDQSKLVPLLTAALQEAIGKIETLETKVAALEAG